MPRTIYSLLVGIDDYPDAASCLQGCINDITKMHEFLEVRAGESQDDYKPLILKNEQATRQAIIDGFRNHLAQSTIKDTVVFYYSGHGSQQPSPPEFWHLEPDRMDETLVCYDSRTDYGWDLADKELAQLIHEVSVNDPHILVVLDCCHSGGATRILKDGPMKARLIKQDTRKRPVSSFLISPAQADALMKSYTAEMPPESSGWAILPKGRHIVLSACRSSELANEGSFEGKISGIFSYYLLDTLRQRIAGMTYRDVFQSTKNKVRNRVSVQSPQMEAWETDWKQPFLGGSPGSGTPYFLLSYHENNWVIDGGIIHGIETGTAPERTRFAVFPLGITIDVNTEPGWSIGQVEVQKVFPGRSIVSLHAQALPSLDPALTYKAVPAALPLLPLTVFAAGEQARLHELFMAFQKLASNHQMPLLIQFGDKDKAALSVEMRTDKYTISRTGDGWPLLADANLPASGSMDLIIEQLEHIARWLKVSQLTNKISRIPANTIHLDLIVTGINGREETVNAGSDIFFYYRYYQDRWEEPVFKIKLKNTDTEKLYFVLLDLPESYGIFPMLDGGGTWLEPGQEVFAVNRAGSPLFTASIPDVLYNKGVINLSDTLKLIVSTQEVDATLLAQPDLPVDVAVKRAVHTNVPKNALESLMHRIATRHAGAPIQEERLSDWITTELSFTTIRSNTGF